MAPGITPIPGLPGCGDEERQSTRSFEHKYFGCLWRYESIQPFWFVGLFVSLIQDLVASLEVVFKTSKLPLL